ncbi:hypothetical protein Poly30_47590 [Planctomycetes bacterium Poly30]|uniref:Uncharacterized protein n=1 Tax=Saltatorellus ferox TaxID=2528018 RepID=A0A518EYN8_9BACT|nr:hypothetical protein Poly30_47590 [Planctomycetes bacterium Poly30]
MRALAPSVSLFPRFSCTSLAISLSVAAGSASAQTAILKEGDPAPNGTFGQAITRLDHPVAQGDSAFGCLVQTGGLAGPETLYWGGAPGGSPGVLHVQGVYGGATQVSLSTEFGLGGGRAIYSSSVTLAGAAGTLDSIWAGATPVTVEGQPVAGVSGLVYKDLLFPGATAAGDPYFFANLTDVLGGQTLSRGLFIDNVPVLRDGQNLSNVFQDVAAVGFDFAVSSDGSHYLVEVALENLPLAENNALVLDGAVLQIGGEFVRESVVIPASAGGIGDAWLRFSDFAINPSGALAFSGDTSASSSQNAFLARNDGIRFREGDVLDGLTLDGRTDAFDLNANGVLAHQWPVEFPSGDSGDAVFIEDRVVVKTGDAVDWNGDGTLDPGVTIQFFASDDSLALSDAGLLYFIANVNVGAATVEALFRMDTGGLISSNYCQANANTTGVPAQISAEGSPFAADNDLTLVCTDMPQGAFGFFVTSQTQGFIANPGGSAGNLCLVGSIGRFQQQIQNSGTQGTFQIPVDLTALPQPMGTAAVSAGQTWNFSTWFRDSDGMGGATSNFSNGIEIQFL